MAKRNADRMLERLSPVSGETPTDRTSVLEHTWDAAPTGAVNGTGSGNSGGMAASTFYSASDPRAGRTLARRSPPRITKGRDWLNLKSIDVVTRL
jgi:hypothetical protein